MFQVHKCAHDIIGLHQSKENEDEVSKTTGWHHKVDNEVENRNSQQQPKGFPKFFGSVTLCMGDVIDCVVIPGFSIKIHNR
jgi:hypothetical protein